MPMHRLAALLLFTAVSLARAQDKPPPPIPPAEAGKHVGERVVVEMRVRASKDRLAKRKEIYLDSTANFRDPKNLGVVITAAGAARFRAAGVKGPAAYFKGKTIRVTGVVAVEKKTRYRILVDDPKQIRVVRAGK
jgi:hypothetical protein